MTAKELTEALQEYAESEKAEFFPRFFKTGEGEYGEGDKFIGVTVPNIRRVCKQFKDLPLSEIWKLLESPIHEHGLSAVILLVMQYKKADAKKRDEIFDLYMKAVYAGRVNNWDIVDLSAEYIIGPHEQDGDRKLLFDLARSGDLWQKRIGIMSAFWYVQHGDPATTIALAEILLHDKHDLIQKAVGWQLREVGKRCDRQLLIDFLDKHAATMPRTALRYAIEHLPLEQKRHYMHMAKNTAKS